MMDRHQHCVYCEIDKESSKGFCIKHNKNIEYKEEHCDDIILKPYYLLCYAFRELGMVNDWGEASEQAIYCLTNYGFGGMKGYKD